MATTVPFYIVDVFAERPLTGNPLALVAQAELLDEATLRLVAREFNQSETTFLLPPHATRHGACGRSRRPERRSSARGTTRSAHGGGSPKPASSIWTAAPGASRNSSATGCCPSTCSPATTGAPSRSPWNRRRRDSARPSRSGAARSGARPGGQGAAHRCPAPGRRHRRGAPARPGGRPQRGRSRPARRPGAARRASGRRRQGCYLYSLDPPSRDATAYARFFNPTVGIWEDPATGSAAGPLAGLLVARGLVPDGTTTVIEQGHAIGRPSRIEVEVTGPSVRLGGAGVVVARGR